MDTIKHIQLLERIHSLILHKSTGTPKQFAKKLNISESTLYRTLEELRDHGAIIIYDSNRPSYIYENEVTINFLLRFGGPKDK